MERLVAEDDSSYGAVDIKHYQITPDGISWIQSHKQLLTLKTATAKSSPSFEDIDDDIPF